MNTVQDLYFSVITLKWNQITKVRS